MNWNREVSKNLEHTKVGITDPRDTAEHRRVLKQARRWARWQRDQLRTNTAVESVAESIWRTDCPTPDCDHDWADQPKHLREGFRGRARAAISALIGAKG